MSRLTQEISIQDVWKARDRIQPLVKKTPLISSPILSQACDASVYLKLEHFHEIGAFKVRGAANKILSLSPEERERGVTTFSTGNHGLAVAYVARKLGIPAVICISKHVPPAKVEAIQNLGAQLEIHGESQDEAGINCYRLQNEKGLTVIHPFDDREVIAGQGTIGLEILEDLSTVDSAIIPLSGGGLFAGIALALKTNLPNTQLIGVSPEHSAVMIESLRAGKPVVLEEHRSLADSLLGGIGENNQWTFSMVQQYLDQTIQVSERSISEGIYFLLKHHHMVVEGAGASGVAALLNEKRKKLGKKIVLVISGSNIDLSTLLDVTTENMR